MGKLRKEEDRGKSRERTGELEQGKGWGIKSKGKDGVIRAKEREGELDQRQGWGN